MCKTEFTSRSSDSPAESQSDGIERPCVVVQRYEIDFFISEGYMSLYIQQLAKLISNQLGRLCRHFGANSEGAAWFLICTSLIS
ncbi:hypothetical protein VN97_g12139 [Penicillium thymicola]|uniref:Uncharacterized protein n=1 Tax=Penicillium thymicola TaxID=293382 RepID=A0AAI9T5W5_PENTH|nr:hypothetical protein VN97_g12139 [Penicillium thymicola]